MIYASACHDDIEVVIENGPIHFSSSLTVDEAKKLRADLKVAIRTLKEFPL